ncbi:MAG: proline--tRNA ligase [Deltaproteobacteria bacterium]|nr:proline--tRNA ligase [Deltaproteobacteria bacterium]
MRQSRIFLPTLKESPSDAEVASHKLMLRAGLIRKVAAGIYNLLPVGLRVIRNVETVVRREMKRAGAEEVLMPSVLPAELWKESGRWDFYGKELLRLKDRHGRDFCLGPTHEEIVTDMVRYEVRSYKQLPLNLYQIQTKFRDEIRPRFGLMRGREFIMKDAYSFHATDECANAEYQSMHDAYSRIFEGCGLEFRAVEAEAGNIGGSFSHEFMVLADTGEDAVVSCTTCNYAANVERAEIRQPKDEVLSKENLPTIEKISTPNKKTIEEVSEFLGLSKAELVKTLIYEFKKDKDEKGLVAVLLRGDQDLNEAKLMRVLEANEVTLATDALITEVTNAPTGFAGPVGVSISVYADFGVRELSSCVVGGNEVDIHLKNVVPERDFKAKYFDLRIATEGDLCPKCDGVFELRRGIEVGHIFKLGTKYSESMGAKFLDENGKEKPMIMGCYGIGIGRIAAAAIEQNHDENGIIWPFQLAPFKVHIVLVNIKDEESVRVGTELYEAFTEKGLEPLLDDRKERAGVKFNDADLLGLPVRIVIGPKTLAEGSVEVKERISKEASLVKVKDAVGEVLSLLKL